MRASILSLAIAATLLTGCSRDTDPGPGGVTQGEAKALDDAAEMLEQRPAPPLVDATVPPAIEAGPAPAASSSAQ